LVILTADHGNDPTKMETTDHTREYIPILVAGTRVRGGTNLGTRMTFADIGATVEEAFGLPPAPVGTSFLREACHATA
jgi:phosphopentomutase